MPSASREADVRGDQWARDQFILSGVLGGSVRDVVGDSWLRSTLAGVNPEGVTTSYAADLDASELSGLVRGVLTRMGSKIVNEPISVIFADAKGHVVHRFCTDPSLSRQLESVSLAPGFTYAEDTVGTNGIGTALQLRAPTMIVGAEHFSEPLVPFACAGAPVRNPVSGALIGVIDLTCRADVANDLLLSYAQMLAGQIESEVLARISTREMSLVRDYLAACRHATGPVFAMNEDLVMMNRLAQQGLDPADRTALIARTGSTSGDLLPQSLVADLPSGAVARLDYRPSFLGEEVVGGVFRVQVSEPSQQTAGSRHRPEPLNLPGVVGTSAEWLRTARQLREAQRTDTWTIVEGERGVGKYSLIRSVHFAATPGRHFRVMDAAAAALEPDVWFEGLEDELRQDGGTLVLRHLDQLPTGLAGPLASLLVEHADRPRSTRSQWIVATIDSHAPQEHLEAAIIPSFDRTIVLEPLRHRPQDVRVIIPELLRVLSPGRELRLSPAAVNQLARHPWPGNVRQLRDALRKTIETRRSGVIQLADLPPECMAVGRRTLTPLEALERDAITTALDDHNGNKGLAAEHLGMSRATIYRKIRRYNIATRT